MKRKIASAIFLTFFVVSSVASTSVQSTYAATSPKAGATCSKVGKTAIYKGKKFTCTKSGKKLVWNKGISVPKPVTPPSPNATKSVSPTPSATPTPLVSPSASASLSPSTTASPSTSPKTSASASASPSTSASPTAAPSSSPSPTATPSPSATSTPKVEPTPPTHTGTADDPQPVNTFLTKNGIKVKVNKVTDKVSELVCKTELIHDGCDFGGAVDAESTSRFVEIVITVVNNGTETWIPAIFGLFKDDDYFGGDFIVDGDIPGIIELEVGQSITLNVYSAISQEVKLKDCLFFISESSAEEAFFLKVDQQLSFLLEVRVRPNASRNKVGGTAGDPPRLVVAVQAPAVDGKANSAVIKELALAFNLRARDFTIVHGELARDKRLIVNGDEFELAKRLEELSGDPKLL